MSKESRDKSIAAAGSIIVHALALLVLFLLAFKTPLPLPGEEGVEVDLGMMDQGMGNIQPEKPAIPMAAQPQQEQSQSKEDIVTQNDEEAPAIEKPKTTKPKQEKPVEQPQHQVIKRALYSGNSSPQAGGSEGITGQPGDQGKPNGLAGVRQYEGNGGKGNGPGYDLGGRGAKSLPKPDDDFSLAGIVVVDIWVDRNGNVTRAETNASTKGSTTINKTLREKAKKAALVSKFAADPDAPEEQHGTITYTFVINQ